MTTNQQIIELIDALCLRLGIVIDWTQTNILPELQSLCGKFINWEIATSTVWIGFGSLVILLGIIFFIEGVKMDTPQMAMLGITILGTGIGVIVYQTFDIVTCKVFPEKALYEYLTKLNTLTRR